MEALLQIEGISKSFFGVSVLNGVDFTVRAGSTVALVGENGAGKSTLMRIISGIYRRDSGSIRLRGEEVVFSNPRQAMNSGIAIIHQELNLISELTVAENIFLGREPVNAVGFINRALMIEKSHELLGLLNHKIDPTIKLGSLPIAQQQMVEIAKALSVETDVIIMDEPTTALTESETEVLFTVVRDLCRRGKGVVFISHRLDEIFRLCDDVVVLRDGEMVYRAAVANADEDILIQHMVGRALSERYPFTPASPGVVRVELQDLCACGLSDISFEARAGEVVGFAGLMGAGRTELAKAILGANPAVSGQIVVDGRVRSIRSPRAGARAGIGFVSEDRKHEGLIQIHSIRRNMTLAALKRFVSRIGLINRRAEIDAVRNYMKRFRIKAVNPQMRISLLSGGNQQKVAISKALISNPQIIIFDEPTRGVDVGAKREIYGLIQDLKARGLCILLMSSDIPELLGVCDRILVLARGRLTGRLSREEATQVAIMRAAVL